MSAFYHAALAQALQIHTCDVSCYILGSSATSNSAGRYQGLLLNHRGMWYLDSLSIYKWVNNRTQVKKSHNIRKNTPQVAVHPFLLYYLCFTQCVKGKLFPRTDIPGGDIMMLPAASPQHCQALCSAHPLCTFFSFVR